MRSRTTILSTAAVLALAGAVAASPGYARTHHHRMHHAASHSSTPAEKAQTAELNRQQLQQTASVQSGNPNLDTTPTGYQRSGTTGISGTASGGTAGSMSTGTGTSATTAPQDLTPAGTDTGAQTTPSGSNAPAPADGSGGTQ